MSRYDKLWLGVIVAVFIVFTAALTWTIASKEEPPTTDELMGMCADMGGQSQLDESLRFVGCVVP